MFRRKFNKIKIKTGGMKIMKFKIKRKAETLSEAVVSIAVFGILLLGLTDFMSSQISFAARNYHRDFLINKAQELVASKSNNKNIFEVVRTRNSFTAKDTNLPDEIKEFQGIVSFDWSSDIKVLTLKYDINKKKTDTLDFALP